MNRTARSKLDQQLHADAHGRVHVPHGFDAVPDPGLSGLERRRSLDWNFFTKLPLPPGEDGGGMANAIVGSGIVILIAALIGVPVGFLGGIYLAEFGGKTVSVPGPLYGRSAERRAVHRDRDLRLDRRGGADASFLGLGRRFALSLMLIPIGLRSTEQFLRGVPQFAARRRAGAGRQQDWKTIATVVVPAAMRGILTGMILGVARIAGETAPLLFTALNNQYLGHRLRASRSPRCR